MRMIARVLDNVRAASNEIVISSSAELAPDIRALVDVPVVVDSEPERGPLGGMLAAFATMRSTPIFTLAGDAPFIDAAFARRFVVHWTGDEEALVPMHAGADGQPQSEPLAAFYDRDAFVRVALRTRYVEVDDDPLTFTNVNTPDDYAALLEQLRARGESA
jgi:molybdopterin-guanine dinucleotide biosynthesis protein A